MSFYASTAGDTSFRKKFTVQEKKVEKQDEKPKSIETRADRVDFRAAVNTTQVVHSVKEAGFACDICKLTFKDSAAYLDHVNSRSRKLFQKKLIKKTWSGLV